ncbi:MAG TPA: hypothetical protein VK362_20585 [Reyranella sp.]|nr:hypothetical protein [Reyranella sp.]
MDDLDSAGIEAAADKLDQFGRHHHWWPASLGPWRQLDPIAKSEFLGIVEQMIRAYLKTSLD